MIHKQFTKIREDDELIEFAEATSDLLLKAAIAVGFGVAFFIEHFDSIARLFAFLFLVLMVVIGVVPALHERRILIHKTRKQFTLTSSWKGFFKRSKMLNFHQISHIEIKEKFESSFTRETSDLVFLVLTDQKRIKISYSENDLYTNDITYNLSRALGCKVHTFN